MLSSIVFYMACGNGTDKEDAVDSAKEMNHDKMGAHAGSGHMNNAMMDKDGADFAVMAASAGMMDVALGEWARDYAVNPKVKQLGAMMAKEHASVNAELKSLAAMKNIVLPAEPGDDHKEHINDLKEKKGADFDKAYINMMADDHQKNIEKFEKAARDLTDPELQQFASKTLPALRKHYAAVLGIKNNMK